MADESTLTNFMLFKTSLLILGNGFDLNCHLNSRFQDFFESKVASIKENIKSYDDSNRIASNIWYILFYLAFYDDQMNDNLRIFVKRPSSDILWMDVESLIKNVLVGDIKNSKCFENRFAIRNVNFLHFISNTIISQKDYILGDDDQTNVLIRFMKTRVIRGRFDVYRFFYNELLKFEKDFSEYIKECVSKTVYYKNNASYLLNKLVSENETFSLISFNYTDIFSDISSNRIGKDINNIHGIAGKSIIIGFDSSDVNDNKTGIIKLSKSWQKMNLDSSKFGLPSKESIQYIKIYGHSLGDQDYSYFHALFDFYDIYSSNIIIVFYYTEYGETPNENEEIRNGFVSKIYSLLNDYTIKSGKEKQVKTIISKLQLENRLLIRTIPKL